jgi:hypothetical protein
MHLHKKDTGTPSFTVIDTDMVPFVHMVRFVPSSPQVDYHIGQLAIATSEGSALTGDRNPVLE